MTLGTVVQKKENNIAKTNERRKEELQQQQRQWKVGWGRGEEVYRLAGRFFTSSSLQACNIILFGCPAVIPAYPFDQSYETAYAKIEPFRLNAVALIGPGA